MADKKRNWLKILIILIILIIVAVGVQGVLLWRSAAPVVDVPTPKMPSPNAYNYYVAAGKMIKDSEKIGYAGYEGNRFATESPSKINRIYTLAEKEALVEENAETLKKLRQGFVYEFRQPPARSSEQQFREFATFRELARLLMLEGQTKEGNGDWGGAVDSYMDAIQLGQTVPRGGAIISKLVGLACQSIGRHSLWDAQTHLNAGQARAAAQRLEEISAKAVPFADTLQEEKWFGLASLGEMFSRKTSSGNRDDDLTIPFKKAPGLKRFAMNKYANAMDKAIANARLPYAARPPKPELSKKHRRFINPFAVFADVWVEILLPVFDQAWFSEVKNEAENSLLTVTLALRAYRLEYGKYPDTLVELVSSYLKIVPNDPFALKGKLCYKLTGDSYVLYSVGPDGKDDGGKPVEAAKKGNSESASENRYKLEETSKGDIVAGINKR